MKNRLIARLVVMGLLPLMNSCAGSGRPLVLGPVGPENSTHFETISVGYLKVYTATEDHNDGDVHYFPHTGYTVYSEDGKTVVQKVVNAISIHDEDPSLVQLPVGKYVVLAEAEHCGMVKIAAIIQRGQLTKIDLEYDWKLRAPPGNAADWVRLPNGQIVGRRAEESALVGK
jgi:hypothetical protein